MQSQGLVIEAATPAMMNIVLLKHQRLALHWMIEQEKKPSIRGGILADDMGLGKTVRKERKKREEGKRAKE